VVFRFQDWSVGNKTQSQRPWAARFTVGGINGDVCAPNGAGYHPATLLRLFVLDGRVTIITVAAVEIVKSKFISFNGDSIFILEDEFGWAI